MANPLKLMYDIKCTDIAMGEMHYPSDAGQRCMKSYAICAFAVLGSLQVKR